MERVIITQAMIGICHMQVCAMADAQDDEILEICNRDNPSGTTLGWCKVLREGGDGVAPVTCADHPERRHFLIEC